VQHDNLNGRLVFLKVNFESGSNLEVTFVCRSGLAMVSSLTSQSFSMFMMQFVADVRTPFAGPYLLNFEVIFR
jgi:hypothetical protein